jgi:uncharacterized protein (DUF983 family)
MPIEDQIARAGRPAAERPREAAEPRSVARAMRLGFMGRCPNCGEGKIFAGYTAIADHCDSCGQAFHHHRADDLPPYLTILIVGHIVVPLMLFVERTWRPEIWIHIALWIPLTLGLTLALLRPIKGAVIGLQWALRMHGFDGGAEDAAMPEPRVAPVKVTRLG